MKIKKDENIDNADADLTETLQCSMRLASKVNSFLSGFGRGAKFGAGVAICIMAPIAFLGFAIAVSRDDERAEAFGTVANTLTSLGGLFAGIALAAFYGAFVGGIIVGAMRILGYENDRLRIEQENALPDTLEGQAD